jgi:cytochrome c peroxidase
MRAVRQAGEPLENQERTHVKSRLLLIACGLVLFPTLVINAGHAALSQSELVRERGVESPRQPPDCGGEPCDAVVRGLFAFFDRRSHGLQGNGRSCADCHMATDHFQLSPASVEARYRLLQWLRRWNPNADDPLFRPIDADDFRINGETASDFSNLRQNGLVRIVFPLPPKIKLIDPATNLPSSETLVDVWRAVPTVNDVALTGPDGTNPWARGPNNTGGYQLDARVTTLQEQALGALTNHAQVQTLPPPQLLDDIASFQRVLFTNHRVRALSDAIREGATPLPDPDPALTELEGQGKVVFARACGQCHGGPGQSTAQPPAVRFHTIAAQCPRPVDTVVPARFAFAACPDRLARNARTYEITLSVPTPCPPPGDRVTACPLPATPGAPAPPLPAGSKVRRTSSDPGRALLTGFVGGATGLDDWDKFDVPGLRGISKTAPYFVNNSAATLEEVVDHYIEFFKRVQATAPPGVVPPAASTDGVHFDRQPKPEERAALLAYLRKL